MYNINKFTKYMKKIVILSICFFISSCATVFSGTSQNINIEVVDTATNNFIDGCTCILNDPRGASYTITTNPAVVSVARGNGSIVINCKKEGYRQLNMAVGDSFNATTVVNVLFWPGFIVDAISGSYKKYPSHYVISMEKITSAP